MDEKFINLRILKSGIICPHIAKKKPKKKKKKGPGILNYTENKTKKKKKRSVLARAMPRNCPDRQIERHYKFNI
jgi:hypothetical protein